MKTKMKKGKITMIITAGIACFVLVLVMTMQFKIVNEADITSIENMRKTELSTELANWKTRYDEVNKQYEETTAMIEEYRNNKESNEQTDNLMNEELDQINMTLGKTDVEGEGILITINETDDDEIENITSDDLLLIVNALKLAGAEAISINDQRIINMSDIVYIDAAGIIRVNGERILAPYTIKAIGNSEYLESSLIGNGGVVDEMRKKKQDVTIERENKITISKYNGDITTKYME